MDEYSYSYDSAHNQTSKDEKINGVVKGTTSYIYDSLNRLIEVTEPQKTTGYTYDAAGNRETEEVTTSTTTGSSITLTTYKYNEQNRLLSTTEETGDGTKKTSTYSYDGNGNMTRKSFEQTRQIDPSNPPKAKFGMYIEGQKDGATKNAKPIIAGTASYEYDVWNQLIKATTGEGTSTYKYNGEGYRTEKTENGATTRSFYEADKITLETDINGKETARNIYGTNLISRTVTTTINGTAQKDQYSYMYNGHGDVTALLAQDGTIAASYYYDAFGTVIEKNEPAKLNNPYRYAGYVFDSATNLYYLNARYYDSKIARFMSEDTYTGEADDPLSLNLYTYCFNNPIMYTDPTGHAPVIKKGSSGDGVVAIQEMLNKLGYSVGKADGSFGPKTEAALKQYQKDNKLKADGIVGNQTLTVLKTDSATQNAPDSVKTIAMDSALKAKSGGISDKTILMSTKTFDNTIKTIEKTKNDTGRVVKTDVVNNKVVITGTGEKITNNKPTNTVTTNKGTGNTNGAVIRASTPEEIARDKKAKLIPYIPVVNTINDVKIVATGSDLYGYLKDDGEIEQSKQNLVVDVGFTIMTAGIGKAVEFADELAVNAVKSVDNFLSGLKLNYQTFAKNELPKGSVSGKDVVKYLKKEGFSEVSQNGSHVKLKGPNGEVVTVPVHGNKDLPIGTLNSIQKQAGLK